MSAPRIVNPKVTDAVAQVNLTAIGNGTAYATAQSFLSSTQAHGTIFASAVRRQEELAIAGLATAVKGAAGILALSRPPAEAGALRDLSPPEPEPAAAEPEPVKDLEKELFKDLSVR